MRKSDQVTNDTNSGSRLGIVMATRLEALPFIEGLGLAPAEERPFRLYTGMHDSRDVALVLSGIGKVNAALATSHLIRTSGCGLLVNCGAAGATGSDLHSGDIVQVDRVVEHDRIDFSTGKPAVCFPHCFDGFPAATCATGDVPVVTTHDRARIRELASCVDMEAAAFLRSCSLHDASGYVFKIITDVPGDDADGGIIASIKMLRAQLFAFFMSRLWHLLGEQP